MAAERLISEEKNITCQISRLSYAAQSLHVDNNILKSIEKMLFNFIWKNAIHYIKKSVVLNTYENGGLNMLDFCTFKGVMK